MDKSTDKKNIVIVGGSYGGASIAHYLLKHAIPVLDNSYQVVLISSSTQAFCRPACVRALISDDYFPQEKLFVDLAAQFTQYPADSFRFIHAAVTAVTPSPARTVTFSPLSASGQKDGNEQTIPYHAVVLATGGSTPSPLLGLAPAGDVPDLRAAWSAFRTALPSARRIVIAGGGPSGVETAGELGEHLNGRTTSWLPFGRAAHKQPKVEITVVTAGSQILPYLRPAIAAQAEKYLAAVGVRVIKLARVTHVSPSDAGRSLGNVGEKTKVALSSGMVLEADLYIPCVGMTPNSGYVMERGWLAGDGRVETNPRTLRVDGAGAGGRVYAIGAVSSYGREAIHNIMAAVPVLGANMKRDLLEMGTDREFKEETRETGFVPIGKSKGVGAMLGWKMPSFMVWLMKGRDYWLWTTGNLWNGKQWAKE